MQSPRTQRRSKNINHSSPHALQKNPDPGSSIIIAAGAIFIC